MKFMKAGGVSRYISLWLLTLPAAGFALSQVADEEFYSARLTAISD
jgi:hypothetical protein